MKVHVIAGPMLALLVLAGCGAKSEQTSAGPAPSSASGTTVAAVSRYDAGPRAGESGFEESEAKAGEKVFQEKGCSACHAFGTKMSGPDLQGVTMRRTAAWMKEQILHPDVMTKTDPIARELFTKFMLQMPDQGLTEEQAEEVIEFLKMKDKAAGSVPAK